jgi:hypothetical protein
VKGTLRSESFEVVESFILLKVPSSVEMEKHMCLMEKYNVFEAVMSSTLFPYEN